MSRPTTLWRLLRTVPLIAGTFFQAGCFFTGRLHEIQQCPCPELQLLDVIEESLEREGLSERRIERIVSQIGHESYDLRINNLYASTAPDHPEHLVPFDLEWEKCYDWEACTSLLWSHSGPFEQKITIDCIHEVCEDEGFPVTHTLASTVVLMGMCLPDRWTVAEGLPAGIYEITVQLDSEKEVGECGIDDPLVNNETTLQQPVDCPCPSVTSTGGDITGHKSYDLLIKDLDVSTVDGKTISTWTAEYSWESCVDSPETVSMSEWVNIFSLKGGSKLLVHFDPLVLTLQMGSPKGESYDIDKLNLDPGDYEIEVILDPHGYVPECGDVDPKTASVVFHL